MKTRFAKFVMEYPGRLPMPIGVYAGLQITGASVQDVVTSAEAQAEAVLALHEHFKTPLLLTAMDLSAEAEAYGCQVRMSGEEIPTVVGRRVSSLAEVGSLPDAQPGDRRTAVHLRAAQILAGAAGGAPVLGGMIGPFSLAARLFGVSEALEATAADPPVVEALLEKTTGFLAAYAAAFREAGAGGVIVAEPAAGLLSPRALARFSSVYVKRIVDAVQTEDFAIVLHNCGARLVHLPKVLEAGAEIYHFGAPMDIQAATESAGEKVILCGNLDPAAVFYSADAGEVRRQTAQLLEAVRPWRGFVPSSGCDVPPGTPLENLAAFYSAVRCQG